MTSVQPFPEILIMMLSVGFACFLDEFTLCGHCRC